MAFAEVSAAGKDAVRPVPESVQDEGRFDPAGAHHPDHPDMGRVLHPADTGRIGCGVTAPVAEEAKYFRLVCHTHYLM
jgi:hypothetical protein